MPELARLAFREEGKWWNAYLARMNTMDGATKLGSIRIGVVRGSDKAKDAFMEAMKIAFAEALKGATGHDVQEWDTRRAPEHERGGHA